MSAMEIPTISFNSMKDREHEIGNHVTKVAQQSCTEALQLEKNFIEKNQSPSYSETLANQDQHTNERETSSLNQGERESSDMLPLCELRYDMGWQKRGSGRCYDSLSGVGTMIGNRTGKIVAFDVRCKDCRKCSYYAAKSKTAPEHDCSKNWSGSSKAMEPDVGACLVEELEKKHVRVGTIIMDDDCTTMTKIKTVAKTPVTKWSDINHTKKHLGNNLYKLQVRHKTLYSEYIQWLQKCFSYAVAQNKNNASGLSLAISHIVPHAFGEHDNCDTNWCTYHKDPLGYRHKSTPYGRDLSGDELETDLNKVFNDLIDNVEKIAPGGSTKDVESFNNLISSKAPKRCHYSASSSLKRRVECAVAQKNLGYGYVNKVNVSLGVSPGMVYKNVVVRLNKIKRKRLQFENTKLFKTRKLQKKLNRKASTHQKEIREGVTYKSGVGITGISDVNEIPPAVVSPVYECVKDISKFTKIYCDVETTSLHKLCDLTQIAAVCNGDSFDKYILPMKPISSAASAVTGLTVRNNVLLYHGKPVGTFSLQESLITFLSWLDEKKPCVLVGHNFAKFPRLIRSFESCKLLNSFKEIVIGIIDTLPLMKKLYPNLDSYSQENIVYKVLNEKYAAHNALADVVSLENVVNASNISDPIFEQFSTTSSSFVECYFHQNIVDIHLSTLEILIVKKVISCQMAKKIASSGLNFSHLKLAFTRVGLDGLSQLFKEKLPTGKPRITALKSIIEKVHDFFAKCVDLD